MPEGFDPHVELDRIMNLRALMTECRKDAPEVIEMYRLQLAKAKANPNMTVADVVLLGETILNRAYGKPRQHVTLNAERTEGPVRVYIPSNNREQKQQITITQPPGG